MAKRGYKLQGVVAHSTNVNCLSIGKKACRLFVTCGDDNKVNLWAIGKPTSLMSLCGHASPVESVAFDKTEVLVLAGASTGVIKLWDLEESKIVRTLTGHKSNCTAVEFHPFGEFFGSGSMDTNLRIWDIRKKGCINTYKGHTQGISTIRFTPDGRWVVSGGFDNVVKVWDLTAGKLLHDFNFHEGQIRSIDFHPLEFLLATGSADRTVKFWDLETFELIGSARSEDAGVRAICFHPDGRTLFAGLDDSLKVYSWEPVICHDAVDMGWSTLGDLCIHEGKLLGCSYYRNSVGVWVADISLIKPYGNDFETEENEYTEQKFKMPPTSDEKKGSGVRSISDMHSESPEYETKEIKNIYVDSTSRNPVVAHRRSLSFSKVVPSLDGKKIQNQLIEKKNEANVRVSGHILDKSFIMPTVIPRDSSLDKETPNLGRGTISFSRTRPGMLLRPAHLRKPSDCKNSDEELAAAAECKSSYDVGNEKETTVTPKLEIPTTPDVGAQRSSEEKGFNGKSEAKKIKKASSPETPSIQESCDSSLTGSEGTASVRIINGVAVVSGRTRSLVERFERREKFGIEDQATSITPQATNNVAHAVPVTYKTASRTSNLTSNCIPEIDSPTTITSKLNPPVVQKPNETPTIASNLVLSPTPGKPVAGGIVPDMDGKPTVATTMTRRATAEVERIHYMPNTVMPHRIIREMDRTPPLLNEEPQSSGRDSNSDSFRDAIEDVMHGHDVFLSNIKSRLTKLQMIRHFWERNDIKGAINAMKRLPDPSVKADVVVVLAEKMDILSLDLFSCLLPVLVSLLDCSVERYSNLSMEALLKLVASFGPVIQSTISAPPPVGVDLHAEERIECCNRCFTELQKIQQILPVLIRKGGMLAKCARELNLVLQES